MPVSTRDTAGEIASCILLGIFAIGRVVSALFPVEMYLPTDEERQELLTCAKGSILVRIVALWAAFVSICTASQIIASTFGRLDGTPLASISIGIRVVGIVAIASLVSLALVRLSNIGIYGLVERVFYVCVFGILYLVCAALIAGSVA